MNELASGDGLYALIMGAAVIGAGAKWLHEKYIYYKNPPKWDAEGNPL